MTRRNSRMGRIALGSDTLESFLSKVTFERKLSSVDTPRVRSRSEDRRARPCGQQPQFRRPIRSLGNVAAATKRRTTSHLTLCGTQLGTLGHFPHPSNYFR